MYNDPRLKNEYHVWFGIHDFECLPEELTKQLGIEPTRTRIKGEYRIVGKKKPHKMLNKENQWLLDSGLPRNAPIEKHLEYLVNKIKPYKEQFLKITGKFYSEFGCALYFYEANPGINLDNNLIKEIAGLNARLDFDIYCLEGTVRQLEDSKDIKHLVEQLSDLKFLSKYNNSEAQTIVQSLANLENACYNFLGFHLPDLIWEGKLTDDEYQIRFNKIVEDLGQIKKYINRSKYLSTLVNETNNKE